MTRDVIMPAMELAQDTGTLLRWLKAEGEAVVKGEPLMEIETDKVTVEIDAPASGVLVNVTAQPGDVIPSARSSPCCWPKAKCRRNPVQQRAGQPLGPAILAGLSPPPPSHGAWPASMASTSLSFRSKLDRHASESRMSRPTLTALASEPRCRLPRPDRRLRPRRAGWRL